MNKKFIAILGMHRSGTSAMAGLFHKLGFYLIINIKQFIKQKRLN